MARRATHNFPMDRPATEPLFDFSPDGAPAVRRCEHPACAETGQHRAPASRERLTDYLWFCLEHVREYNSAWDFFRNMSEAEIEQVRRGDSVWQRPSWPFSNGFHQAEAEVYDKLRRGFGAGRSGSRPAAKKKPPSPTEQALTTLDLAPSASFTEVKTRYKKLAKKLHPDANGGDTQAEDRLKVINQAYATLKKAFSQ